MRYNSDWQKRNCLETALALHNLELPITLCRGERPIAAEWPYHTYSPAEIEYEFEVAPDLNVGLVLGSRSGLMEVVAVKGDGMQSERDFNDLVDQEFLCTPTFTSRSGYHRLFELDGRLASLGLDEFAYKSLLIRIGDARCAANTVLPPGVVHGVTREWLIHFDNCRNRFQRLPFYAIDRIVAVQEGLAALSSE
jgi:hypothetical protein